VLISNNITASVLVHEEHIWWC